MDGRVLLEKCLYATYADLVPPLGFFYGLVGAFTAGRKRLDALPLLRFEGCCKPCG